MTALSFRLSEAFIADYTDRPVPWGFRDAAGNSVGELVFLRTYSRLKDDGTKETWAEVCRRVVEGTISIQKDWAKAHRLPWSDRKAAATAQEMFDRMFHFKWVPPGRGFWMMGTPLVNEQRNSAALQNCAFVSTGSMTFNDPAAPFAFLMEASMLGIGVGFDTLGADKGFKVYEPPITADVTASRWHTVPDTREGWVESLVLLLESYLLKGGRETVHFDYSAIRPAGAPIRTFGGTAAGPEPLRQLHEKLRAVLDRYVGRTLDSTALLDIGNLIGVCVVSGNVRRSAELALGSLNDPAFLAAKDYSGDNAYRAEWGWMSNNSIVAEVGDDLSVIADGIRRNGEPGVIWLGLSRDYGRLVDPPNGRDHRVMGYNPCAEQSLGVLRVLHAGGDLPRPPRVPRGLPPDAQVRLPLRQDRHPAPDPLGADQRNHGAQPADRYVHERPRQLRRHPRHRRPPRLDGGGLRDRPALGPDLLRVALRP